MKVRLFDFLDLTRPLAKAARDFDWTEIVALFPDAQREGLSAAKIWVLASVIVLSEITGLSEGEVLLRWLENPYWQAFSGFEHFQWQTPATPADCLAFRRFVTEKRAARLSLIASSIRDSKPVDTEVAAPLPLDPGASSDKSLALRQVHFLQPLPSAPYKAPPRPDFQSSIKHTYAKAAAVRRPDPEQAASETKSDTAHTVPTGGTKETAGATAPTPTSEPSSAPKPPEKEGAKAPPTDAAASAEKSAEEHPQPLTQEPAFVETYAQLFRKKGMVSEDMPKKSLQSFGSAPPPLPKPVAAPGSPQFDTTTPLVLRVPPGEPIRMEVSVSGEAPLRYQWEQWDDLKGISIPIEGCNEHHLTVALEPEDSMLAFQCRVSNNAAPEGIISRTFFIKKGITPPKTGNTFGEKFDPQLSLHQR
jgi:hypothetical protein